LASAVAFPSTIRAGREPRAGEPGRAVGADDVDAADSDLGRAVALHEEHRLRERIALDKRVGIEEQQVIRSASRCTLVARGRESDVLTVEDDVERQR
jgi:hypothetical protein